MTMRWTDLPEHSSVAADVIAKQQAFAAMLGLLIHYAALRGWGLTLAEGYVGDSIDKPGEDSPHKRTHNHFIRMAQDLNLWVEGRWVRDGSAPEWLQLGYFWKTLHPLARWGGDWADANHFSLAHNGKK